MATLFCDYMPPANTARGKMTATTMYLYGRLAKIQKAGLDGLKAMFPGAPDDFYKDALTLVCEKHEMLEARVDKLEAKLDVVEKRVDVVELKDAPSRKSFDNFKVVVAEELEELKDENKALKGAEAAAADRAASGRFRRRVGVAGLSGGGGLCVPHSRALAF